MEDPFAIDSLINMCINNNAQMSVVCNGMVMAMKKHLGWFS